MNKFHSYNRLSLITAVILSLSLSSFAALNVQDTLSGGTWSSEDSPIMVNDNIFLPDDATLIIEPGVRVVFSGAYNFLIEGSLRAVGTRNDSIVFTAENPTIDSLHWRGLRFINSTIDCELRFCTIEYSWARGQWPENCGGGIYLSGTSPEITRCTIIRNSAEGDGGGVYAMFTTSVFRNNLIVLNNCQDFGGGFFVSYAELGVVNCTISMNNAGGWGGGIFVGAEGSPFVTNCIIDLNTQDIWDDDLPSGDRFFANLARSRSSEPSLTFTCLPTHGDAFDGQGNISDEPEFLNIENEPFSFHLDYSSPCIDAGDPEMNPGTEPDLLINRVNIGAYGGTEDAVLSVPVISNSEWENGTDINFGSIRTNAATSEEITITNNGHFRLFLYDFIFTSSSFYVDSTIINGRPTPSYAVDPIEAGESVKFALNFSPTELRDYADTLTIVSNDTLQVFPGLSLTGSGINPIADVDSTLSFGEKQIGRAHIDTIWVSNLGTSDLSVSDARVQGDGFTAEVINEDISPGDSGRVSVVFRPTSPEDYNATVSVSTNDRDIIVPLSGTGVGPMMTIEADTLFMGYVYSGGDTAIYTIDITNDGDELLIIDEAENTLPEIFSAVLPGGSIEIQSGSTHELSIYFHPDSPDVDYETELVVSSNYPIDHSIVLSGRGMAEPGSYVFGEVGGSIWDWFDGHGDYIVLDSVYVPAHEKLKIMPGARILFEPGAFMQVDGELRAIGLPDDSIRFIPRGDTTHWDGLYLAFDDATTMSYCNIYGSVNGGISIHEASPLIQFCTITNNSTEDEDYGGGIYLENSGARIIGCEISYNSSPTSGGIYILNSKPVINNCIIKYNTGDGVYLRFQAAALIQNNIIFGNSGDGISISDHSAPRLINNTVVNNSGNGVFGEVRSVPYLINSIFYYNDGAVILDESSNALVSYCDIEGGFEGTNNLDIEPSFVNAQDDYYYLTEDSPLIDEGNSEYIYRDHSFPPSLGTYRNDIGAYGGPLGGNWETPEVSISAFQNPAFNQWIDIFVTSLAPFDEAPVCTLELGNLTGTSVQLNQNPADAYTYMGSYEANQNGSQYIMVDAVIDGVDLRVSRALEFNLIGSDGGTIQMVGAKGHLTITPEANNKSLALISGCKSEPLKPSDGKIFLSPLMFIMGMDEPLDEFVEIQIELDINDWDEADLNRIGVYRYENRRWQRLNGGYAGGILTGKIDRGGHFAVALDDGYDPKGRVALPGSAEMLSAYPNPFNQEVKIEFQINQSELLQFAIYDLAGRRVAELLNREMSAGKHEVIWDGNAANGRSLPSGIYWARLKCAEDIRSVKLLLLR